MEIDVQQPNTAEAPAPGRKGRSILLYLLGSLLALGVFLLWMYHDISPVVHGEYGEGVPPVTAFCRTEGALRLADEGDAALGDHVIEVVTPYRLVPCLLKVRDTTAPAADPVELAFASGYEPAPNEFIANLRDADMVGVSFSEAYDFTEPGRQTVVIDMEDGSGNRSQVTATASIRATRDRVTVEAGSPAPAAETFCDEGFHGTLLTEITDAMLRTPGEYPVDLRCVENGRVFSSILQVRDTQAPAASGRVLVLQPGEPAAPEEFLVDILDETDLTFSFVTAPDPERNDLQDILIRATDAGGNAVDVAAQVLFSNVAPVTVEVKNGLLTPEDIGVSGSTVEEFPADQPGTYTVRVQGEDGLEQYALVTLTDTTAPALSPVDGTFYTKHPLSPEALVDAVDVETVSLAFLTEPDWESAEEQTFQVKAVDAAGNETVAAFSLTLLTDETAPNLYGVLDRICYVGEPVLYLQEAYAEDDVDGRVEMTVDSQVILSRTGRYAVTYSATDQSGNTASKTCTYTMVKATVSEKRLDSLTTAVLKRIIKPDMVTAEKLKAVFNYVYKQVRYTGSSDKTDWRKEAVRGLTDGKGDCFTYYAVARALLEKLEIPYMSVTRLGGATRHYWLLVNFGTGWYHFDCLKNSFLPYKCFMWTNQQLKVMPKYFWRFAEEDYPPIATEPFDYNAVVEMERQGLLP